MEKEDTFKWSLVLFSHIAVWKTNQISLFAIFLSRKHSLPLSLTRSYSHTPYVIDRNKNNSDGCIKENPQDDKAGSEAQVRLVFHHVPVKRKNT